jgi:hypothetical protein
MQSKGQDAVLLLGLNFLHQCCNMLWVPTPEYICRVRSYMHLPTGLSPFHCPAYWRPLTIPPHVMAKRVILPMQNPFNPGAADMPVPRALTTDSCMCASSKD